MISKISAINLQYGVQYGASLRIDMGMLNAPRESFHAACLASCYFGGGLIKVRDWLPGLTLRVALGEGPWLSDLPDIDDVIQRLNRVSMAFNHAWDVVDYDIRTWLRSPRQSSVHHIVGFGKTSVCRTEGVHCLESPAMTWYACWPGMPEQHPEKNAGHDYRDNLMQGRSETSLPMTPECDFKLPKGSHQ